MGCVDHGRVGNAGGYQTVWFQGRYIGAHVRALILSTGEQPDERQALHSCDNPRCINSAHLRWGTQGDNMRDAVVRGRHVNNLRNEDHKNRRRGADNHAATITEDIVREMRRMWAEGATQTAIGRHFGYRQSTVQRIVRRKAWAHLA